MISRLVSLLESLKDTICSNLQSLRARNEEPKRRMLVLRRRIGFGLCKESEGLALRQQELKET